MYLSEIVTAQYWFADPGMSSSPLLKVLLIAFGALFVLGVLAKFYFKFKKSGFHPVMRKLIQPIPGYFLRWGALGVILVLFRYEGARYVSWRIWWLIFLIWVIYKVIKEIVFVKKEYAKRMEMYQKRNAGKEWEVKSKGKKSKGKKRR